MVSLSKIILILASCFALTFIVIKATGILTVDQIQAWLEMAKSTHKVYVFVIVIGLLFADLFIAVPTLSIVILSGYFLGFPLAIIASLLGMSLAGIVGFWLSLRLGDVFLLKLLNNEKERENAINAFNQHGFIFILLSRAMPILPEVSACLAGITAMHFKRFFMAWTFSMVPYATVATYAGSISSITNPKPAIYAAIGISATLWLSWVIYHRYNKTPTTINN
ncbi:TVP38/TMEM64 family protein [Thalassotalea sediminis]|uniref:TVP38/TMEM64 family protein n=1 Tax=Thalassotalea sediminis TaxID=1759089 RepID=UPI0025728B1E|nr:VTT domain-containing protein [Thalassotalea sediminis]